MPTALGTLTKKYGRLPNSFHENSGTGDFQVITADTGHKFAIYKITAVNTGTGVKEFRLFDNNAASGRQVLRLQVLADVESLNIDFDPPIVVNQLFADSISGTDAVAIGAVTTKFKPGF